MSVFKLKDADVAEMLQHKENLAEVRRANPELFRGMSAQEEAAMAMFAYMSIVEDLPDSVHPKKAAAFKKNQAEKVQKAQEKEAAEAQAQVDEVQKKIDAKQDELEKVREKTIKAQDDLNAAIAKSDEKPDNEKLQEKVNAAQEALRNLEQTDADITAELNKLEEEKAELAS